MTSAPVLLTSDQEETPGMETGGRKFGDPSPVLLTLDGRGVSNANKRLVRVLTQRFLSSGMKNKKIRAASCPSFASPVRNRTGN